ncbi:hypothetical protein [Streptomyces pseudovenezuelae]|uniref:Uncharacterized protein n=1 Tax=Streptomyces pseudovenezuelae TaxID=67350 RepID=A0ABT6LZQ5_9ACTN|nr:hypothetical protein [Streptomyces pseudovenezuelae]MDH6221798.1 hypothetical protein [Streptomyces pseudovenezuelae]
MAAPTARFRHQAGQDWLLTCAPYPAAAAHAWDVEEFGEIPSGPLWRVVEAPLVESLSAIQRIGPARVGPILGNVRLDTAWWLLPPELGDDLDDVRGFTVRPAGWSLRCPPVLHSVHGRWWIERPDGSGRLTDPVLLAAAFGPGGYRHSAEALG